jgi:type II secretory pathway component PulF
MAMPTIIEPLTIVVAGVFIGAIIADLYLPMFRIFELIE